MSRDGRILASHWAVPAAEVPAVVAWLQSAHVGGEVLVDGRALGGEPRATSSGELAPPLASSESTAFTDGQAPASGVRLAHAMLWSTFDRAARVQAWMLEQANGFTRDMLENNRKLADQASELQLRFQQSMERIDLMETEQRLIEHDLMARRLSRHAMAQERAEDEASRPPTPPDRRWIEDLLSGVGALLDGSVRPAPRSGLKN